MSRKAMQVALEALESDPISHAGLVTVLSLGKGTGLNYALASQKTAVSPDGGTGFIDGVWHEPGPTAWRCQCGKPYTVTCISSKPAKQEPVAWISEGGDVSRSKRYMDEMGFKCNPLYTEPPKREWVGLTAEEVQEIHLKEPHWGNFACAIEAKLKEKNHG